MSASRVAGAISMAWHFTRHKFTDLHPLEVSAQLLNACNLRCVYCKCPEIPTRTLSAEQWVEIVRGLARFGTKRFKVQGGEPTIFKGMDRICAEAQSQGMKTAVTTNGFGIVRTPALLDTLDEVVVSIDALQPELHDRYRGEGSHAIAMQAADLAADRGCRVYINMIVHRDTECDLPALLEYCERRGFCLNAQAIQFSTHYQDEGALHIGLDQEAESGLYRRLAEMRRQGRHLMFSAETYEKTSRWPDYRARARALDGQSACMAGNYYVHIEPNGDIHPCNFHVGTFTPKNILVDGLESALKHTQCHHCADCGVVHLEERKRLFSLQPDAVLQLLRRG